MANLKKPTLSQKKIMKKNGLNWENWLVPCRGEDNISIVVVNRKSGRKRVLLK